MFKQKKYFDGFMNADDEDIFVGLNEYLNAVNLRFGTTDNGKIGGMESIQGTVARVLLFPPTGTTLIPFTLPDGDNLCVGAAVEENKDRLCWFNWNSNGDNAIYCYNRPDNIIYNMTLGFYNPGQIDWIHKNNLMDSAITEGLLYWTNDVDAPRRINIDACIATCHTGYVTTVLPYTDLVTSALGIDADTFILIRRPPALPPDMTPVTLGTLPFNYLPQFSGQFAYRYIYRDGEPSVLSPISARWHEDNDTTHDTLLINVPNFEKPGQDIQQIDFCVRYDNGGGFFIWQSLNIENAVDLARIQAHLNNIVPITLNYSADVKGAGLSLSYSLKGWDSVPLKSKALCIADNRLFLGKNTVGYKMPTITSLTAVAQDGSGSPGLFDYTFVHASPYKLGVQFRDKYKRPIGGVITNGSQVNIPERDYVGVPFTQHILWTLTNGGSVADEIPEDAYYYDVVITKNLRTRFFLEDKGAGLHYVYKDDTTGLYTYVLSATVPNVNYYGIAVDVSTLTLRGLGYTFQEGDIMKLWVLKNPNPPGTLQYYELPVLGQDGKHVIVQFKDFGAIFVPPSPLSPEPAGQSTALFEIFTPYIQQESEPYYTTGILNTGVIDQPGTPSRQYANAAGVVSGTISRVMTGDSFYEDITRGTTHYNVYSMNRSKFHWKNWLGDWGLPTFELKTSEQTIKEGAFQYSDTIIGGTKTNGLSSFDVLNERILPTECGELQKLIITSKVEDQQGLVMLGIGRKETVSMYLGEVQLVGSTENAVLASAPNVIGTINILKGSKGTRNPESVCGYEGRVYWYDGDNGEFIMYSLNGLEAVSRYKLRTFTKQFSDVYISLSISDFDVFGSRPFVFGCVDQFHREVLWSIPQVLDHPANGIFTELDNPIYNPYEIFDGQSKTLVFKIDADRFQSTFKMEPEFMVAMGRNLFMWKAGQPYQANIGSFNDLLGDADQPSSIAIVCNAATGNSAAGGDKAVMHLSSVVKTFENVAIEANVKPVYTHARTEYPDVQSTDLIDTDYTTREGVHYATFMRDRLSPNVTGTTDAKLYIGDKLRGVAGKMYFEFHSNANQVRINFINIGYIASVGHKV